MLADQRAPCSTPCAMATVQLVLPFELRQKSRLRTRLPRAARRSVCSCTRGSVLAGWRSAAGGRRAHGTRRRRDRSRCWTSRCADDQAAGARGLSPRQPPCRGRGRRRLAAASPTTTSCARCVEGLGASVTPKRAPFEPEAARTQRPHARGACHARQASFTSSAAAPDIHDFAHRRPALVRLLQLASPALPVGAFSYSQGFESAVEQGWVHDAARAALDRRCALAVRSPASRRRLGAPVSSLARRTILQRSRTGTTVLTRRARIRRAPR